MKKVVYRISEKAVQDLEDIWLYTFEAWSQKQADRYYNLLIGEIEYIAKHFEVGKSMGHIRQGYRACKIKSHLIFYRRNEDEVIEVIRILHEKMDIENKLK